MLKVTQSGRFQRSQDLNLTMSDAVHVRVLCRSVVSDSVRPHGL